MATKVRSVRQEQLQLARSLRGHIWKKLIARNDVAAYKDRLPEISSRLVTGRTLIRVYGEAAPEPDFEPVEPDLEDLYFWRVSHTSTAPAGDGSVHGGAPLA
jgi:hypothetical protein